MLSCDITLEEMQMARDRATLNKAVGVDDLPKEVLRTPVCLIFCIVYLKAVEVSV